MVEPHSSNFRVITTNVLGVQIFRKFTVYYVLSFLKEGTSNWKKKRKFKLIFWLRMFCSNWEKLRLRPDFFYLLIYGRASPKILAPPEKWNCNSGFYFFYLLTHHIFGVKCINFTCIFGEKLFLFDWPKLFHLFNFIFISSSQLIQFQNFPVNQLIKKCWPNFHWERGP